MALRVKCVTWDSASEQLKEVREKVFVCEYRIPRYIEFDKHDSIATHVLVEEDGHPIATGRISPTGRISRIAVLLPYRGSNAASVVLHKLMDVAKKRGCKTVSVNCQLADVSNFLQHGFSQVGGVYMEAGIPRQKLECPTEKMSIENYTQQLH